MGKRRSSQQANNSMRALVFSVILLLAGFEAFSFPMIEMKEESSPVLSYITGNGSSEFETTSVRETIIGKLLPFEELTSHSSSAFDSGDINIDSDFEINQLPTIRLEAGNLEAESDETRQMEGKETRRSLPLDLLDEIDEEEVKLLQLEESDEDQPPEGFPPGFFQKKFISLRRLGEPEKSENKDDDKIIKQDEATNENPKPKPTKQSAEEAVREKSHELEESRDDELPEGFPNDFFQQYSTGLRRLQDPANKEGKPDDSSGKANSTNSTEEALNFDYIVPTGHWRHFTSIARFPWKTLSSSPSGYGYYYQQPNAHGFVYHY